MKELQSISDWKIVIFLLIVIVLLSSFLFLPSTSLEKNIRKDLDRVEQGEVEWLLTPQASPSATLAPTEIPLEQ